MRGLALLCSIAPFLTVRTPVTGLRLLAVPRRRPRPESIESEDTNRALRADGLMPMPPNMGPYEVGSAPATVAFPSPIGPQATNPPFITTSGLMPKKAGCHRTTSAIFPTSRDPT